VTPRGFSLVELLVAMVIVVLLTATIGAAATQARAFFERIPAVIDMQQRGTAALSELSQALRSAVQVTGEAPDGGGYSQLTIVRPIASPGQGVLAADQAAPGAAMTLAVSPCPNLKDVCGFTPGTVAMIADGAGFDVFIVAATNASLRSLTPAHALSHAYLAGSAVIEVEQNTYGLDEQNDGTFSLTRVTAGGAVQPVVDGIRSLSFDVGGHRVAIEVVVHALADISRQKVADRSFRRSINVRNLP
jgi:prepilin-type N-terminal cleavage/methylation domain-containing protein